jgi:hypothetical protein
MRATASECRPATVFYIVNVLLFPITLIGYVIWLARIYMTRRNSGASITALGPLSARSMMHILGLRRDQAADRLLHALPSTSGLAVLLTGGPCRLSPSPGAASASLGRLDSCELNWRVNLPVGPGELTVFRGHWPRDISVSLGAIDSGRAARGRSCLCPLELVAQAAAWRVPSPQGGRRAGQQCGLD